MSERWQRAKAVLADYSGLDVTTFASSTAYFSFISLFPLLVICISLVSTTGLGEQEVVAFFTALVPDGLDGIVQTLVKDAFEHSGLAFSLSTVSVLWSASKGVKALRRGLNVAYAEEESRGPLAVAVYSMLAAIILGALLAALIYLIFSKRAVDFLVELAPNLEQYELSKMLDPTMTLLLSIPVIAACYAHLPSGTRRFMDQLPGAVFASLACAVLSLALHMYMDGLGGSSALYGSFATVVLFLIWMYYVCRILISGGYINRQLSDFKKRQQEETERGAE